MGIEDESQVAVTADFSAATVELRMTFCCTSYFVRVGAIPTGGAVRSNNVNCTEVVANRPAALVTVTEILYTRAVIAPAAIPCVTKVLGTKPVQGAPNSGDCTEQDHEYVREFVG